MNIYIKTIAIISILIMFSSCEKELTINTKPSVNKIVVNSIINSQKPIKVELTKSFSPYGVINVEELTNASVKLYDNDSFKENLVYRKLESDTLGNYNSVITPQVGHIYHIEVSDDKLGKASATTTIPKAIKITNASVKKVVWGDVDNISTERYEFSFEIIDGEGLDYYIMKIGLPVYAIDKITNEREFFSYQYTHIIAGSLPDGKEYIDNSFLFNDNAFDNGAYTILGTATTYQDVFEFDFYNSDKYNYELDKSHLYISVHRLSEELYKYYSSHSDKLLADNDLYAEPISIYNNITNGFGIFGGESVAVLKVKIKP